MEKIIENHKDRIDVYALQSLKREGLLELTLKEHTVVYDALCKKDPIASQAAILNHFNTATVR